jgi:hypothetical protein
VYLHGGLVPVGVSRVEAASPEGVSRVEAASLKMYPKMLFYLHVYPWRMLYTCRCIPGGCSIPVGVSLEAALYL